MVFQPAPDCVELEIVGGCQGQTVENVWHMKLGAPASSADCLDAATHVWTNWADQIVPHLSTEYQLQRVIATALDSAASPRVTYVAGTGPVDGADSGSDHPNNVAMCFKKDTGLRGRSQRGRCYLVGLTHNAITNSNITAAFEALILPALNTFLTNVNTAGPGVLAVLSRYTGGALRSSAVATPIGSIVMVDGFSDSQRRRLPGHNRHH